MQPEVGGWDDPPLMLINPLIIRTDCQAVIPPTSQNKVFNTNSQTVNKLL